MSVITLLTRPKSYEISQIQPKTSKTTSYSTFCVWVEFYDTMSDLVCFVCIDHKKNQKKS